MLRNAGERGLLAQFLVIIADLPKATGALPGSVALAQARADGTFTSAHDAFWAAARARHGDSAGTKALVDVLLLHRHLAHADVVAGITAAVAVGATSTDVVAVEARNAADARGALTPTPDVATPSRRERVASLTQRRLRDLPPDKRPLPTVDKYDQLLHQTTGSQ